MAYIQEYPILGTDGKTNRFVGNKPARGFCFDTVERCFRRIGTKKWIDEKEIVKLDSTPPTTNEKGKE